jgi:halocyanin-like protein
MGRPAAESDAPDRELGDVVYDDAPTEENRDPDPPETYDGWIENDEHYDGVVDRTSADEVRVLVGSSDGLRFQPAAVRVTPGKTVIWSWTGLGGSHDVVSQRGPATLETELHDEWGHEYAVEFTSEHVGVTKYSCRPHEAVGMRGVVEVVED